MPRRRKSDPTGLIVAIVVVIALLTSPTWLGPILAQVWPVLVATVVVVFGALAWRWYSRYKHNETMSELTKCEECGRLLPLRSMEIAETGDGTEVYCSVPCVR